MSYRILALGSVALLCLFVGADAFAQEIGPPSEAVQGLLNEIRDNANNWADTLRNFAIRLFWGLALIQLIWTFWPFVFKQADFGELIGELIRTVMVLGFFAALLHFSVDWAQAVVDSFRQAGSAAADMSGSLRPGDVFQKAVEFSEMMRDSMSWTNPGASFVIGLSSTIVLLCFAFIAAFMFVTLVEAYIVINASVLFMGFGASQWTREYAIAMLRYALAVGAKLFVLTLIVGLIIQQSATWQASYAGGEASSMTLVGLALVCAYLVKTIPDLIQGLITGVSPSGGSTIGAMAAGGLAGGAAVAGLATGGLGALAGAAKLATGAAAGGNSLQNAIGASMAGGGSGSSPAMMQMAGMSGGGHSDSVVSSLTPRTGGTSAAPSASSTAGSGTMPAGEMSKAAPQPGGPAQAQAKPAAPQGSGGDGPSASDGPAEPSRGNMAASTFDTVMTTADAVARGTGLLGAISVPGMEGAAATAAAPLSSSASADDDSLFQPSQGPAPGEEAGGSENTIGPARLSVAEIQVPGMATPQPPTGGQPPKEKT